MKSADRPVIVTSFLQELIYRSSLKRALAGRDETTLKPVLTFLSRHITNPRFSSVLIDTGMMILDLYGPVMGQSPAIDECFVKLQRKLQAERKFQQQLFELLGQMDLLLASQEAGEVPVVV
jgi:U3 small nucleolar RNA-associated protein 15